MIRIFVCILVLSAFAGLPRASAKPSDCTPGRTEFTLTNTSGAVYWRGIRLAIGHFEDAAARKGVGYASYQIGEVLPARASLKIAELDLASTQDTPSLVRSGRLHLASNVPTFARTLSVSFGGIDVADLSHCSHEQVNLHCGAISYYASENAIGMKCSLVIFDPADIVTP